MICRFVTQIGVENFFGTFKNILTDQYDYQINMTSKHIEQNIVVYSFKNYRQQYFNNILIFLLTVILRIIYRNSVSTCFYQLSYIVSIVILK